jgi:ATP-dependent protease HslVU (ClpYQ) peptidase subunit
MTTIIGIQGPGWFVMAGDSRITGDHMIYDSQSTPKVIKRGSYVIGISGDSAPGDVLTYTWKPPVINLTDPIKHMGSVVIPSIRNAFSRHDVPIGSKKTEYRYLIGFNQTLFYVDYDLAFYQDALDIYTLGSGGELAKGYLLAKEPGIYKTPLAASRAAKSAIETVARIDFATFPPVTVMVQE